VPLTTHIKVKDISKNINSNLIVKKISTLNKSYIKLFKTKPKIGILGLNPHNGEMKKDSEERTKILPAILSLKKKNINIQGPIVADTAFVNVNKKINNQKPAVKINMNKTNPENCEKSNIAIY